MAIDYKSAGVDVERGYEAVRLMKKYVKETYTDGVLGDLGSFGGFYALDDKPDGDVLVAGTDGIQKLLSIEEFKDAQAGLNFQGTGTLTTPLGAKLLRTSAMPAGILIGLDRNYALEMVRASDVLVEYDKLIDRQLERAAITSISGFAKLFTEASKVLVV